MPAETPYNKKKASSFGLSKVSEIINVKMDSVVLECYKTLQKGWIFFFLVFLWRFCNVCFKLKGMTILLDPYKSWETWNRTNLKLNVNLKWFNFRLQVKGALTSVCILCSFCFPDSSGRSNQYLLERFIPRIYTFQLGNKIAFSVVRPLLCSLSYIHFQSF